MAELARLQYVPDRLTQFFGVNLRRNFVSLRDEDLARSINLDLHAQVGTPQLRKGRTQLYSVSGAVRLLRTFGTTRYGVAGTTLYKSGTSLVTGLHSELKTSLLATRPLNDVDTWVFLADRSSMQKETGGTVRQWGITAPTAAPTLAVGGGTGLTGAYTMSYTYARMNTDGTVLYHESNPSPTSNSVTVTNQNLSVTGMTASSDGQVTHKRLYRTVADGSTRLLETTIANATTTATLSVADTALGAAVETDNNRPPATGSAALHQEHVFFLDPANPSYLWWSKRYRPESVPTTNFLDIGSTIAPLTGLVSLIGLLGLFSAQTKYRVMGNATSGFLHQEALSKRGTAAPQAVLATEKGCVFVARDGVFLTNFVREDEELSGLIAPLFEGVTVNDYLPVNWDAASTMSLAYWKSRLYWAYASGDHATPDMVAIYSFHTQHWYFYQLEPDCRALYAEPESEVLIGGTTAGVVAQLESGTTDLGNAISIVFQAAQRFSGAYLRRKRFDYLTLDYDAGTSTLLVEVLIDEVVQDLWLLTGKASRRMRLRGAEGYIWQVRITATGTGELEIGGLEMQAVLVGSV